MVLFLYQVYLQFALSFYVIFVYHFALKLTPKVPKAFKSAKVTAEFNFSSYLLFSNKSLIVFGSKALLILVNSLALPFA